MADLAFRENGVATVGDQNEESLYRCIGVWILYRVRFTGSRGRLEFIRSNHGRIAN